MHAVRNIRLCTKDCLCLYVCPTGATDTETGQIDASKCLSGCRACVDACPSHAISLIPDEFPPQQEKTNSVKNTLLSLAESKTTQEKIAKNIAETGSPTSCVLRPNPHIPQCPSPRQSPSSARQTACPPASNNQSAPSRPR